MEFKHKSVLLEETIEVLDIKPDGIYVDGTLGGAGHAGEVCRKLSAKGRFIGIDQDQDAIIAASERLAPINRRRSFAAIIVTWYRNWQQEASIKSTGFSLILEYLPISLTMKNAVLPTGRCTARYAHGPAPDADSRRYCQWL